MDNGGPIVHPKGKGHRSCKPYFQTRSPRDVRRRHLSSCFNSSPRNFQTCHFMTWISNPF
jgi:hypothetical protein